VLLELGNPGAARAELETALTVFRRTRSMENRAEAIQSLLRCLRELKDRKAESRWVAELLDVARKIGRPVLIRRALNLAIGLAVEGIQPEALVEHLQEWQALPGAGDQERAELRKAVGHPPASVMESVPEVLRKLLTP
jgi:hypothetical protein